MLKKILIALGIVVCLTALFANQLGIDNDSGWGNGRIFILKTGGLLIVLGLILYIFNSFVQKIQNYISTLMKTIGRERLIRIAFIGAAILIAITYVWFLRLEERKPEITFNFYSELAKGFKQGHFYLQQKPSAALMGLTNPYDFILRKQEGIEDFPWDVSLYEGRFYIYWGPTPTLFLLPFREESLTNIEDFHLSLIFAYGLFIYSALILADFWSRLKKAPIWLFILLLFVIGLSIPIPTMLKSGEVYEASIFACQFFFIGGCYWAYSSMKDETPAEWKFALASLHWTLAIGARVTILPAVGFAVLVMVFPIFRTDWKKRLFLLLAVGIPLLAGGVALAWYNYARFDSIFEFGIRYQLANVDYTHFKGSFNLNHLAKNLTVYFTNPLNFEPRFPFISLVEYTESNDRISGLLYTAPFIVLLLLPVFRLFVKNKEITASPDNRMLLLFSGATVISAFIIFIFYFIALRYTLDFLPSTWLLIALSLGLEFESLKEKRLENMILSSIVIGFAGINITTGILLGTPKSGVSFMLNFLNAISKVIGLR